MTHYEGQCGRCFGDLRADGGCDYCESKEGLLKWLTDQIREAQASETEQEDIAEYQGAAYQRGRHTALTDVLEMLGGGK